MRKLACDGLVVSFNRPGGNFLQRAGEDRLSPLTVLWDAAPTICNLLGTCCLFNLVPTFPQSSPFQAWGLDPRKRRDAHGHASTYSGDQGAAQSDGARFKVERSLARIFGDTPSQSPAEEMWRPRQVLADDETYADTVGSSPLDRLTRHATVAFRSQSTSILSCAARRLTIATWFVI